MNKVLDFIKQYEENKISLEELQDYMWGLPENSLDDLSDEQIVYYLGYMC